ncbi:MAG: hypothetical protein NTZ02_02640, partial [Candidatus Woesearchaeota archaeon]|nr:hypothetical protein [Candidatus Woesearchaeota archaeon]
MNLKLNDRVKDYKEFDGNIIDEMPLLIAEGRTPMSTAEVMQRRLDVLGSTPEVEDAWWMNFFHTGDAVAYHPDGRIKVVLDSQIARELNPKSTLRNGALVLSDGMYEQMQGEEFSRAAIEYIKYFDTPSTVEQVLSNPIWRTLARDPKLLQEYATATFKEATKFNNNKNMAVYRSSFKEVPNLRLWSLGGLNRDLSYAFANISLDDADANKCLVGVALFTLDNKALDDKVKLAFRDSSNQ